MKLISRIFVPLNILLFTLAINACSSGGGGGTPPPPPANTNVAGSVVKGTIKNALVEIFAIEGGIVASTPIETTTTDADNGKYSFTLAPNFSGPIMIVVRDDPNGTSTMTCDVVTGCGTYSFGADMPLGDIELKTIVANVTGGSAQTAAVTPYTLMAAEYAMTLGLTSDNIAAANSQVGNLLGINNIVITEPPNITQTPNGNNYNESKYAYLIAAVASLAEQNFGGDIAAAVSALVNSYANNGASDGQLLSSESVDDPNVISLAELAAHANMQAAMNGADGQVQNALDSLHAIALASTDYTSAQPSPTSGLGDVEKVKSFVADVRTWGNVIDQEIQNSGNTFDQQVDMADVTFDIASPLLSNAFDNAFTAAGEAYVTGNNIDLSTYSFPVDPMNPVPVVATGSVTVTNNASSTTVVLNGVIDGVTTSFTLEAPLLDNGNLAGTQFDLTVSNLSIQNAAAAITAESGTIGITYPASIDLTSWMDGTSLDPFPDPDSGSLALTNVAITEVDSSDPVSYSGSLSATVVGSKGNTDAVVRDEFGYVVQYNPASISFDGELSNSANSITAHISAVMDNADTFMPLPGPQIGDVRTGIGSYAFSNGNNTLTITVPGLVVTISFDTTTGNVTVLEQYTYYTNGPFIVASGLTSLNDYLISIPSTNPITWIWVDNEGYYEIQPPETWTLGVDGSLDGIIISPDSAPEEDATNFRALSDINIRFNAQLDGLPEATFWVTGNRTGFEAGDATMTIAYGGRRIEISAEIANNDATGTITITNQDQVVIIYDRSDVTNNGIITYNGTKYADIEEVNGITIIRYTDGYFDSL